MTCPPELLTCNLSDFTKSVKYMAMQDLIAIISTLEDEITKDQEEFARMNDQITDENSPEYHSIGELHDKIKDLLEKTQICFNRRSDFENRNAGIAGTRKKNSDSWIVRNAECSQQASLKGTQSHNNLVSYASAGSIKKSSSTASLPSQSQTQNTSKSSLTPKLNSSVTSLTPKNVSDNNLSDQNGFQTPWGIMRRKSDTPNSNSPNVVFQASSNSINNSATASSPRATTKPSSRELTFQDDNTFTINLRKTPQPKTSCDVSLSEEDKSLTNKNIEGVDEGNDVSSKKKDTDSHSQCKVEIQLNSLSIVDNSGNSSVMNAVVGDDVVDNSSHFEVNHILKDPPIGESNTDDRNVTEITVDTLSTDEYEDEKVEDRPSVINWDPIKLLKELYEVKHFEENIVDVSKHYINIEGVLERLPANKKKATLLKTWRKQFFRAKDGFLYFFESSNCNIEVGHIQLMGGVIEDNGYQLIGIDDRRGHYLVVRCASEKDQEQWMTALNSQTVDNAKMRFVRPVLNPKSHGRKKIVIIDIGSASIRAGVLGDQPSLPTLFFPTVAAISKKSNSIVYGFDAFKPNSRRFADVVYPLRPSLKFNELTAKTIPGFVDLLFEQLDIETSQYKVMLSIPHQMNAKALEIMMDTLFNKFHIQSVQIAHQAVLALHAYRAKSGIVVDIGDRYDVLPVIDGYLMAGGLTRQPIGGAKIMESLNQNLAENKYRFLVPVEQLLSRLVMEKTCFVSKNFAEELSNGCKNQDQYERSVDLSEYDLPYKTWSDVSLDVGRFTATEGLFETELWGLDLPYLHKVIYKAIQECPMDTRRELCRSIYLSGGGSMLPGLADRIQYEIEKMTPESCVVEVHAMPNRYHAAYIGACIQADSDHYDELSMKRDSWINDRNYCLRLLNSIV
ncbi:uncharacterized protein LOC141902860 [Tubulanus polymorphus]|uniref:uncharacterized protein LOC141902860 n=1 Tax=Tubulanus polymorphus TaxID=672921 RepID=UPI003DA68255